MQSSSPLAVLYDRNDALSFLAVRPQTRAVLALSPNARLALLDAGYTPLSLGDVLGDRGHARIVARSRAIDRRVARALDALDNVSLSARSTLFHSVHLLSGLTWALALGIGRQGPWLVPAGGQWRLTASYEDAVGLLVGHLLGPASAAGAGCWAGWLLGPLNRLAAAMGGVRPLVIQSDRYGLSNLCRLAAKRGQRALAVRAPVGGWRDWAYTARALWQALSKRDLLTVLAVPGQVDKRLTEALAGAALASGNATLARACGRHLTNAARKAALTQALVPAVARLLARRRDATVVLHSARWGDEAALAEGAGLAGLWRLLMSHGSHAWPQTGPAAVEHMVNADGLLTSPLVSEAAVQSPLADAFAVATRPALPRRKLRPTMWGYRPMVDLPPGQGPARILHAGTFKPLPSLRPWIYESADEYVSGLVGLVRAVEQVGNAHLVIRLRPGRECDAETLARLLPAAGCWEIKTTGTFLEDLAQSDLLVSYASTTIEEALNARRPVLLWGGTQRSAHVPARRVPPMAGDRGVVYAPASATELPGLLASVLAAHRGNPLTEAELECVSWPTNTPGADDLVGEIIRRAGQVGD